MLSAKGLVVPSLMLWVWGPKNIMMQMLVLPFEWAVAMVIRAIPARIVSTCFLES